MKESIQLTPKLSVGPQPKEEDLRQIATFGTKSIINLRTEGEDDQPMSPAEEGLAIAKLGMEYRHIPVSPKDMSSALVDRFRAELADLPTPVLVHCASGKRAAALTLIHLAIEKGLTGNEALSFAENEFDLSCDDEDMRHFVRESIDTRR